MQIAFGRAFFAGLALLPLLRRGDLSFRPAMLATAVSFAAMNALYVTAMAIGSAANAVFLQYTAPMWMALVSIFWLKEPADRRTLIALAVGMAGVAVIVIGGWGDGGKLTAAGIAVGSGVAYAGVLIGLRVLRAASSRWLTIFNHLFAAAALAPALFFCWKATPSPAQLGDAVPVRLVADGDCRTGWWRAACAASARRRPECSRCWNRCSTRCGPSSSTGKRNAVRRTPWWAARCILAALAWRYWPGRRTTASGAA